MPSGMGCVVDVICIMIDNEQFLSHRAKHLIKLLNTFFFCYFVPCITNVILLHLLLEVSLTNVLLF